jgi:outer membrane protein
MPKRIFGDEHRQVHVRLTRWAGFVPLLLLALTLVSGAQELPEAPVPPKVSQTHSLPVPIYVKPASHFPNLIAPYAPQVLAPPRLSNSARIDPLMHDGKLYVSLNDATALALENNLDLAIARYNLNIAQTDVLRAKAGASILGVETGLVLNTPGGGVGGIGAASGASTGGTTLGSGGAGAGTNGLVSSTLGTGAQISSFDPVLSGTLQLDKLTSISSTVFTSAPFVSQNTYTANFAYQQSFEWGTNLSVSLNNSHQTTNNTYTTYSPLINSAFQAKVTQHLLQGFGLASNTRLIRIAKNNRELSDVAFRLQVVDTVDQIENIYWDLVYTYENERVQHESLTYAEKALADTKKQVEMGVLAPLDLVRAESAVATDQQALTAAETNLLLEQLLLKNAISRNLDDQTLAGAEVIPTSTMDVPAQEPAAPTAELIGEALGHRAELAESRIDLDSRRLSNQAVRNAQLPALDLFAYYGGSGVGGNPTQTSDRISYGNTLNQLVNSTAPDKGIGLSLNITLRNRAAEALQIRSELEYAQARTRLQQIENQVVVEVRNAQFAVQQYRASVESARAALELARRSLVAEQKKYEFGSSTTTAVLQYQSQLATAECTLVNAMVAYEKAHVELDRATGRLLDQNGVSIGDAARARVERMPNAPFIAPRQELPSDPTTRSSTPDNLR